MTSNSGDSNITICYSLEGLYLKVDMLILNTTDVLLMSSVDGVLLFQPCI